MNTLIDSDPLESIDSGLVDSRFTLGSISKVFYLAVSQHIGSVEDEVVLAVANITPNELEAIRNGSASIELMSRACDNLFLQFVYAYGASGIQARVKAPSCVYRLTP